MDLFLELLLTVLFSVVLSFLVAKLVSVATPAAAGGVSETSGIAGAECVVSAQKREIESERRVQVFEGGVEKVDKFSGDNKLPEEVAPDLVGRTDRDVGVGHAVDRVSEEKIVELLTVDDEIVKDVGSDDENVEISGDVGEKTGNIGVAVDIKETLGSGDEGRKFDEFDGVEEENAVADEIVEDIRGDQGSFENSGAMAVNNEDIVVEGDIREVLGSSDPVIVDDLCKENASEEKFAEHLLLDDEIVKDVRYGDDSFENTVAIGENLEKLGGQGDIKETLGNSGPVADDEVAAEERSGARKLDELDDVGEEKVGPVDDVFGSSGVNNEIVKSIGIEDDIMVKLGTNDPVFNEVVVQEVIEGRKLEEKIVEHVGADSDSSQKSGANFEFSENIGAEGGNIVNLWRNDPVTNEMVFQEEIVGMRIEEKIVEHEGVDNNSSHNPGANLECAENVGGVSDINVNLRTNYDNNLESGIGGGDEKMRGFIDDDWEGIERSELEESFAAAATYVFGADKSVSKFDSDVKMELYGLNKVALEGPCREPQPMAIKVSARAKWNAWQRLGNMSPEVAMEQYISLLSDKAPKWKEDKSSGDGSKVSARVNETSPPDINERDLELNSTTTDKVI